MKIIIISACPRCLLPQSAKIDTEMLKDKILQSRCTSCSSVGFEIKEFESTKDGKQE